MLAMNPGNPVSYGFEFEREIATMLIKLGFHIEKPKRCNYDLNAGGLRIQCKATKRFNSLTLRTGHNMPVRRGSFDILAVKTYRGICLIPEAHIPNHARRSGYLRYHLPLGFCHNYLEAWDVLSTDSGDFGNEQQRLFT